MSLHNVDSQVMNAGDKRIGVFFPFKLNSNLDMETRSI